MRFVSPFLIGWWVLRTVNHYVPIMSREVVALMVCLYSVAIASLYIVEMFSVWQTQLIAMGTDESVGNTFLVAEWLVTVFATASSVYWLVDTDIPVSVFVAVFTGSVVGHFVLKHLWKKHLESFMFHYNRHLPDT